VSDVWLWLRITKYLVGACLLIAFFVRLFTGRLSLRDRSWWWWI
jgi:phage gp46-like protein